MHAKLGELGLSVSARRVNPREPAGPGPRRTPQRGGPAFGDTSPHGRNADGGRALLCPCARRSAALERRVSSSAGPGSRNDLRRHGKLYQVQVHGLCRGSAPWIASTRVRNMLIIHPDECIDCGGLRAGVPGRSDQAGHRAGSRAVAQDQRRPVQDLAQHHPEERGARERQKSNDGMAGKVREVLLKRSRARATDATASVTRTAKTGPIGSADGARPHGCGYSLRFSLIYQPARGTNETCRRPRLARCKPRT